MMMGDFLDRVLSPIEFLFDAHKKLARRRHARLIANAEKALQRASDERNEAWSDLHQRIKNAGATYRNDGLHMRETEMKCQACGWESD